jgi:hypothetical protein
VRLGLAGVSRDPSGIRWRARIGADTGDGKSKQRYLGDYVNEVDAALAYDQAAREHHGKKAQLNFPHLPPQPKVAVNEARHATSRYRGKRWCNVHSSLDGC